ncbi:MAG: class I SAM-dependent methyltransferase, partial [Cyclobacteriaceae bacterium]
SAWYNTWFNSPYYHILYKDRDQEEAIRFINHLNEYFDFQSSDKVLDLACGKGRHAIYLNSLGLDVVGVDLSPKNIAYAQQFENDRLHFYVHDMREVFQTNAFDYVLNLFTSIGYFDTEEENEQAIIAATQALKPGSKMVIDFLNPYTVIDRLVPSEIKIVKGIQFKIDKYLNAKNFIVKNISFEDQGRKFQFQEKVKAIRKIEFLRDFIKADLKLLGNYGDYNLNPYDHENSERMIFVLQK